MTGAQILAIGGIVAAALTALGGWAAIPAAVGLAGTVMLAANLACLVTERRKRLSCSHLSCSHLADSEFPERGLERFPCRRCGRFYVDG